MGIWDLHRTGIWGSGWFIQQVFIEHMPCAWHIILSCGDTMVNPTDKALPLMEMTWPHRQSYFSLTLVWIFSGPQLSTLKDVPSVFQLLVWNLLPINKFLFWGTERDYTQSVYMIRGVKISCRLFKICTKIYKHDLHSRGLQPKNVLIMSTTTKLH